MDSTLSFLDRVKDALALEFKGMNTVRCPKCGLRARFRVVSDAERARITGVVTNHANHA